MAEVGEVVAVVVVVVVVEVARIVETPALKFVTVLAVESCA